MSARPLALLCLGPAITAEGLSSAIGPAAAWPAGANRAAVRATEQELSHA